MPTPIDGSWNFDAMHSTASVSVPYLTGRYRRDFESFTAELADGKLSGSADVRSLTIRGDMFREHVIDGAGFFDAGNHPTLTFSSDTLQVDGDKVTLDGKVTIKGVTKPIHATGTLTGPAEDHMGNTRLGLTLGTTIDRTDFDVGSDFPVQAMAREVDLEVDLYFLAAQ